MHHPLQTDDNGNGMMGIVFNLDGGSEMVAKIDFQTCDELKSHGVSISGYFMIGGVKTYCNSWSKFIFNIERELFIKRSLTLQMLIAEEVLSELRICV